MNFYNDFISKENKSTQRMLYNGCDKLLHRYEEYKMYSNDGIFGNNDDVLVHDIINSIYYVYKCRVGKIQLRILYCLDYQKELVIVDYFVKNNSKNSKDYIRYFESVTAKM